MTYPATIDTFRQVVGWVGGPILDINKLKQDDQNNMANSVEGIMNALGINPQGGFATVLLRLADIDTQLLTIADKMPLAGGTFTGPVTCQQNLSLAVGKTLSADNITNGGSAHINMQDNIIERITRLDFNNINLRPALGRSGNNFDVTADSMNLTDNLIADKLIQSTAGDIECVLSTKGLILDDRTDANRYRLVSNNGVITTEIA